MDFANNSNDKAFEGSVPDLSEDQGYSEALRDFDVHEQSSTVSSNRYIPRDQKFGN